MTAPLLYVIEGTDAAGKATQTKLLAEKLKAPRISFPRYDTPQGRMIEDLLFDRASFDHHASTPPAKSYHDPCAALQLQALMTIDRYACAELWDTKGPLVLDRYWMSGWVYGQLDGLDPAFLEQIHRGLPPPTVAIFLDVPPNEQLQRLVARGRAPDKYEEKLDALERTGALYSDLWLRKRPARPTRWVVVEGVGSIEEVHQRILRHVDG